MQQLRRTLRFLLPRPAWSTLHALAMGAALACAPSVLSAQSGCTEVTCQNETPGNTQPTLEHQSVAVDGTIRGIVTVRDPEGNLGGADRMLINGLVVDFRREQIAGSTLQQAYRAYALQTVPAAGGNTITFYSCDLLGSCGNGSWEIIHAPPEPPPVQPASPNTISVGSHGGFVPVRHWAATAGYATPAYISRDQPRSVGLHYSSEAVAPGAVVSVNTMTPGDITPTACTIWLLKANGSRVPLRGGGTERAVPCHKYTYPQPAPDVIVETDESATATGAYTYTVVLRRAWPDGTSSEARATARVLVVNNVASRYGSGWSLAGIHRLHIQSDGVLIENGDGSATFFEKSGTGWIAPAGDFTELTFDGTWYYREFPDKSVATFDQTGRLVAQRDRFSNVTRYSWGLNVDGVPVIRHITDPAGKVTSLDYHGAGSIQTGKLASVVDPAGRVTQFGYWDGGNNLTNIVAPGPRLVAQYAYDAAHRMMKFTDESGAVAQYNYDNYGRLQVVTLPAVTLSDGRTTTSTLTHTATPTSLVIRDERSVLVWMSGINWYGQAQRIESPGDVVQTATYDEHGRLRHSLQTVRGDTLGEPVTYVYSDPIGGRAVPLPSSVETPSTITVYGRSLDPVLVDGVTRNGSQVSRSFLSGTPLRVDSTSSLLPDGTWGMTRYTYDGAGRLTSVRDPKDHTSTIAYDPTGMQNTSSTSAEGMITSYTYDAAGRATGTTVRNKTLVTGDGVNVSTSTEYDAVNRVLTHTGPTGTVRYSIDIPNRSSTVTDQKGQTYTSRYNARGWRVSETDPRGRVSTFGYDQWGNVTARTNRRGQTVRVEYDTLHRPTLLVAPDDRITYSYDPNHRWAAVANGSSVDTVYTDDRGRTTREASVRNTRRHVTTYVHADPGYVSSMTVQLAGQPTSYATRWIAGPTGIISNYAAFNEGSNMLAASYDSEGKPTSQLHRSTGLVVTQEYDEHRLKSQFTNGESLNWHARTDYRYDVLGRIRTSAFTNFVLSREVSYDTAGRLRRYVDSNHSGVVRWADYSYDAAGNPTNRGAVVETGNRITQLEGELLTYDEDGNTLSWGGRSFTWNTVGQLTGVNYTWGKQVRYYYDGLGRRVRRVTNGVETQYVYAAGHLVAELNGAGTPIREFSYYPGTDRPYALRRGGQVYKYIQDAVGDVVALANSGNGAAFSYKYDPWGNLVYAADAVDTSQPLRYRAREYDSDTGLYQNRARWYDPQLGRFLSEDPIGIAGGLNVYAYAGNDPVNSSDPSGLSPECTVDTWWVCLGMTGTPGCTVISSNRSNCALGIGGVTVICSMTSTTCESDYLNFANAYWATIDVTLGTGNLRADFEYRMMRGQEYNVGRESTSDCRHGLCMATRDEGLVRQRHAACMEAYDNYKPGPLIQGINLFTAGRSALALFQRKVDTRTAAVSAAWTAGWQTGEALRPFVCYNEASPYHNVPFGLM